jgi:hypothetical protein
MVSKIKKSIEKFKLNLTGKIVLTEAASGNYVVTPIVAALAGARVIAIAKESRFATIEEVKKQTYNLAKKFNLENSISIVVDKSSIDYQEIDILTNTGFVRPINKEMIDKLSNKCVIPLMWEPWEYREADLDLDYCNKKGIKVYGTNESDSRLQTMKYIGFTVLNFLLENKMSPFSSKVLVLGNEHFVNPIIDVLSLNGYIFEYKNNYNEKISVNEYTAIVIAEHENNSLLIGNNEAFINTNQLDKNQYLIHICGNVDFTDLICKSNTKNPATFGYMSFTTDYIDNQAVIDLHTAGLKVAEGMLKANELGLSAKNYKKYMENNYPSLSFENEKYW